MAFVNLKYMPTPNREQVVNLTMLNGGLNLSELDYRLKVNESPQMRNLMWRDGVLCSRDGQEWVYQEYNAPKKAYAMYERLFYGMLVVHVDNQIWLMDPDGVGGMLAYPLNVPLYPGVFFQYNDDLYYKNKGGYYKISFNGHSFSADEVDPYVPIIVMNADYATGVGDIYQPENRITYKKRILFNQKTGEATYQLPLHPVDSITKVVVGGVELTSDTNPPAAGKYYADATAGTVTLGTVPAVDSQNNIEITYSKQDSEATEAYNSVMDCNLAATYGGTGDLCVVFGGCPEQPNAIFWNGQNSLAMDPSYFPMLQYQLVGSANDPVTGFGKQQSFLVVFQERSVGRVKQDITTVDGRAVVDMPYTAINAKIGCDLPKTIQLIENNLVWCNTDQGVHLLKDSSYAYENNIACISTKINGGAKKSGLLENVRTVNRSTPQAICSMDDEKRYWLCVDGICWVWDYEFSDYRDPSWYYMTSINARAFCTEYEQVWHVDEQARVTRFSRNYSDYGAAIDKSYRFATQYFGGYDRLKNVNSVILSVRPDTNSETEITYLTDYEARKDLTNLKNLVWSLSPWDLTHWVLYGTGYGTAFRRRPMCRRIKHFTMQLDNNIPYEDLSIVSAQIFYNYQGRLR